MHKPDSGPYRIEMQYAPHKDTFFLVFTTRAEGEAYPWDQQFSMQGTLEQVRAFITEIDEFAAVCEEQNEAEMVRKRGIPEEPEPGKWAMGNVNPEGEGLALSEAEGAQVYAQLEYLRDIVWNKIQTCQSDEWHNRWQEKSTAVQEALQLFAKYSPY